MTAIQLLNHIIPPLKLTDSYSKALSWMQQFHVQHLPVTTDGKQYIGMLDEYAISDTASLQRTIAESELPLPRIFVYDNAHVYEVLKSIQLYQLSAIAVLNHEEEYIGVITLSSVLSYMAVANSVQEVGSIIILEMGEFDYVLSNIARIIESNDTKILSLFAIPRKDSTLLDVTIKVNRTDLDALIASLERHGYEIRATYQTNEHIEDIADHYHSLMHYLNI